MSMTILRQSPEASSFRMGAHPLGWGASRQPGSRSRSGFQAFDPNRPVLEPRKHLFHKISNTEKIYRSNRELVCQE